MRALAATLMLAATAGAGSAQSNPPAHLVKSRTMPPTYSETAPDYAIKRFERPAVRTADAYAFLANKTRLVLSPGAPLQVTYSSAEGAVALWFPGTGATQRGRWHIEEQRWELMRGGVAVKTLVQPSICFDYSGGVPNAFAPEWRRGAQCTPLEGVRRRTVDQRGGDIFGLAKDGAKRPLGSVDARKLDDLAHRL